MVHSQYIFTNKFYLFAASEVVQWSCIWMCVLGGMVSVGIIATRRVLRFTIKNKKKVRTLCESNRRPFTDS